MDYRATLEKLMARVELEAAEAEAFLESAIEGLLTDVQVASILVALQMKGPSGAEIAALARVLRLRAVGVNADPHHLVDTCGTGGGRTSFNISTAAAFVAAASGAKVAKHGNRAVTSHCGSADVLESLGVRVSADPEVLAHQLETVGIAFLFAPNHHPALKSVGPVRKELSVRTVFNQLGPLANPAGAQRQVIGVYSPTLLRPMSEAVLELGTDRTLLVHSSDGMDEISPCANTSYLLVEDSKIREGTINLKELGLKELPTEAIECAPTVEGNASLLREALSTSGSVRSEAIVPSAAAALWMSGLADSMANGIELAKKAIGSGAAQAKLEEYVASTQST